MVSVLTNTPNRHCHFYLLTDYISEKNKGRFSRVEKQYANCSIHYQLITEKIFDSFHRNIDYLVSPVSYYRYIIPELSPPTRQSAVPRRRFSGKRLIRKVMGHRHHRLSMCRRSRPVDRKYQL